VVSAKTQTLTAIVSFPSDIQPSFQNTSRVIIMHQGALGDFLLALPVFEGLHRLHPDMRLDFWTRPNHVALIASRPYLGQFHSTDGPELTPFFHDELWKEAAPPAFFQNARAILVFGQATARTLADRLGKRVSARVAWIRSFPDATCRQPVSRFLVRQMQQAGWPIEETLPRLNPAPAEKNFVQEWFREQGWGGSPVVLHPGSGGVRKIWPLQRWWELLRWLCRVRQAPVVMVMGPADGCLQAMAGEAVQLGVTLARDLSLPRLAALLAACRLYIGNDSGVTHLAAVTGTPCIAIFGKTSPQVWAPPGQNVRVLVSQWREEEILHLAPNAPVQHLEPAMEAALRSVFGHRAVTGS
jgi:heptosyltransferase III